MIVFTPGPQPTYTGERETIEDLPPAPPIGFHVVDQHDEGAAGE